MPTDPIPVDCDPASTRAVLKQLLSEFQAAQATNIGFPAATDLDFAALAPFLNVMINNLGDPRTDGAYPIHTKAQEREAVNIIADLLRAPDQDRWGYVTGGASEGTEHALSLARSRYPRGIVYYSQAAHHCVPDIIGRLAMPSIPIRATERGEIDYQDLTIQVDRRRDQPVIVVANIGTAMTEAVDDIRRITTVLDDLAVTRRWVHADAALSGIPLAMLDPGQRPGFDFADGADSIIVSAHKFIGSPMPCGVLVVRDSLRPDGGRPATYTGSPNSTLTNSRSGLAALGLWYTLREHGSNLRQRAEDCRALADYACGRLRDIGVNAWRHPLAFTVVLPTPPHQVTGKWVLVNHGADSHIVCMPGVTREHIETFITDLQAPAPAAEKPPNDRRSHGRPGRLRPSTSATAS